MISILEDLHSMSRDPRFIAWDRGFFADAAAEIHLSQLKLNVARNAIRIIAAEHDAEYMARVARDAIQAIEGGAEETARGKGQELAHSESDNDDEEINRDGETRSALLCALYEWINAGSSLDAVITAMDSRYGREQSI